VFGIWGHPQASRIAYYALHSLQHRGQEGTGLVVTDGVSLQGRKGEGLVTDIFTVQSMAELKGFAAIGHVRYSLGGSDGYENVQPLLFRSTSGSLALCHNGNLLNGAQLRRELEEQGSIFQTSSDSEVLAHLIRRSRLPSLKEQVKYALSLLEGAYAFLLLTEKELVAALDPRGMRPLSLGRLDDAYVIASETCAFDIIGAQYIRSVEPGEILVFDAGGMSSHRLDPAPAVSQCIFEHIYFARPDSLVFGEKVDKVRRRLGKQLALESPCEADIVISVPDSGNTAALGFSQASGVKYEIGLIRNHYVGRTFIAPHQDKRNLDVRVKLNPVQGVIEDKRVVLVDDSIVRGTTMRQIVKLLRSKGASEVHVRISSPPVMNPCFYGIDISARGELIACNQIIEEIRCYLGADSLAYLSHEGLLKTVDHPERYCEACFTGEYPTEVPKGCGRRRL